MAACVVPSDGHAQPPSRKPPTHKPREDTLCQGPSLLAWKAGARAAPGGGLGTHGGSQSTRGFRDRRGGWDTGWHTLGSREAQWFTPH